ncbi:MAG: class I SAM-dependent methyltransferase [Bacteroidetes bacterium]|nr:class I SAM-dependent methyltransferase [Bacteroidota bacterium]
MNDALHWNNIADNYDKEIFNVFQNDKKKKLKKYIRKYANKKNTAIDFGCGVGKALPLLSPLFKEIIGVDVSKKCIAIAKSSPYKNVAFREADLAAKKINLPFVDFAFCCNVAMSDDIKRNYRIIQNVLSTLNKGGVALFVLPSLESASLAAWSLISWYEREGVDLADIPKDDLAQLHVGDHRQILDGVVMIDRVPTKHYQVAELYALFNSGNFVLQKLDRLEYGWNTEFESPPRWMQAPYPWDWVVEAKRVK